MQIHLYFCVKKSYNLHNLEIIIEGVTIVKRFLCVLTAVMLLVLSVAPAALAATSQKVGTATLYVKTANGKCLLVRSEPSKNGTVLYCLSYGAAVKVPITASSTGTWTYIQGSGKRSGGYVMTKYLVSSRPGKYDGSNSPAMNAMTTVATPFTVKAVPARKGGTVNLRQYADKSSTLVAKLLSGEELTVVAESQKWYQVKTADGKVGYVYKQYTNMPDGNAA